MLLVAAQKLADLKELSSNSVLCRDCRSLNFNGLVRHSYWRSGPEQGDLQINLTPGKVRNRA